MYIVNDPGPWQFYHHRQDNIGLNINQLQQKFLTEQLAFEQQQFENYMSWLQVQGKGIGGPESTPEVEILTENGEALLTQDGKYIVLT